MRAFLVSLTALAALAAVSPAAPAKREKWTDAGGKTFTGEAAAIAGPFAVFRTTRTATVAVRLQSMSPADCVRLHEALRDRPLRAPDWAKAQSVLSREVFHHARQFRDGFIVPVDLTGRPEPELFLLLFGWHDHSESWDAIERVRPVYERVQKQYPGLVEVVFFGSQPDAGKHGRMVTETKMPWLVTAWEDQRLLRSAVEFARAASPYLAVVTRDGVLVNGSSKPTVEAIDTTLQSFEALLEMMEPNSPKSARDRLNYVRAVQPVIHATSRADPVMIACPLTPGLLKANGIPVVDAVLSVDAAGAVTAARLTGNDGLAPELIAGLEEALKQSICVPAVDHGRFVAGELKLHMESAP